MRKITKQSRRDLHAAINELTHDEVAAIVRQQYPRIKLDEVAKAAIAGAHRIVSPRKAA